MFPSKLSNLPLECLQRIFHEFEENSLYSCCLVNRTWCQIAIPLLWRSPFHFIRKDDSESFITSIIPNIPYNSPAPSNSSLSFNSSKVLIQTYLRCLPNSIKNLLIENGLNIPKSIINTKSPLFRYETYIKSISYSKIYNIITEWFEVEIDDLKDINEREGLEYLVTEKLIRLFISSSNSILNLSLTDDDEIPSLPPISLFPNSENSLRNLVKLTCIGNYQYNMKDLLISLIEISRNIKEIIIGGLSTSVEIKLFGKLIKSQKSLKSIEILGNGPINLQMITFDILNPLYTQKNTLENIKFLNCDFEECTYLYPIIFLPMLKSIEFEKCRNLVLQDLNSINNLKNFIPKLQIFKSRECYIPPLTIETVIRNSYQSLSVIELSRKLSKDESKILLYNISPYCKGLKVLDIKIFQDDIEGFLNLLKYCENLKELTIFGDNIYAEDLLPLISKNLSTNNLKKLCFIGNWIFSNNNNFISLINFLQNFKFNLPKILTFQSNNFINNNHLNSIINWIIINEFEINNFEKLELIYCEKCEKLKLSQDLLLQQRTKNFVIEIL
ncbi:hypothetical protein RhiirA5_416821 [Rhizophagus irregularis]|jgi:hypothetical protein|uniref:F-box domain-containing protein n=1 Tax=Rhizophagus irregularis TaxID=588596 RepID=A0A2I1G4F3_9GLOM|nr:hypothetical protein RhiirA5_416821 [Rhizophagus irregularis]PKK71636.1 hypothetical protein RhiirC2_778161 [Rhizophagus irregularis]PKY41518.1 hypothetical protein RhiirA4_455110 [Rhizophagus irregularis]CAB4394955.1 unnamed protein product [Rhizophagus irregularis]CAB4425405.1 unnamed protein product [Rhizophagus irregularis]